jgi:hypothetical protein
MSQSALNYKTIFDFMWMIASIAIGIIGFIANALSVTVPLAWSTFLNGITLTESAAGTSVYMYQNITGRNVGLTMLGCGVMVYGWRETAHVREKVYTYVTETKDNNTSWIHDMFELNKVLLVTALYVFLAETLFDGTSFIVVSMIMSTHTIQSFCKPKFQRTDMYCGVLPVTTMLIDGVNHKVLKTPTGDIWQLGEVTTSMLEMATGAPVSKIDDSKSIFTIVKRVAGNQYIFVGNGVLGKDAEERSCCYTVAHNFSEEESEYFASKGSKQPVKINKDSLIIVGDVAMWYPDFSFGARLAISPVRTKKLVLSRPVRAVYTLRAGEPTEVLSSAGIPAEKRMVRRGEEIVASRREYTSSYSTEKGASGCGIYQDDSLVGIHNGSEPVLNRNYFTSLTFVFPRSTKNVKIGANLEFSSVPENSYEILEDYDLEEFLAKRTDDKYLRHLRDENHDDADLLELASELWNSSDKRGFRDLEAELTDLDNQGYGRKSKEAKAVVARYRSRNHESKKHLTLVTLGEMDFHSGRDSLPQQGQASVITQTMKVTTEKIAPVQKPLNECVSTTLKVKSLSSQVVTEPMKTSSSETQPNLVSTKLEELKPCPPPVVSSKSVKRKGVSQEQKLLNLKEQQKSIENSILRLTTQTQSQSSSNDTKSE